MNTKAILASLALASSCSALSLQDITNWKIQGEHTPGHCAEYAFHLNYKLSLAGIDSNHVGL